MRTNEEYLQTFDEGATTSSSSLCPTFAQVIHTDYASITQGVTGLHSQQSRAAMPMDPLHQENFSVLTDFVNESATFFKVSTFISDTFFSSIMSLTK
jgi:hypothetical protein